MKKYNVKLASLVLFFATGAAMGMERYRLENVYLENQLTARAGWILHHIKAIVTYTNGSTKEILVYPGGKQFLGDVQSIAKIEIGRYSLKTYGTIHLVTHILEKYGYLIDNITESFQAFVEDTMDPKGPDVIITVKWKIPESNTDYAWKYAFSTGTVRYPWNWVINNTNSDIQIKEIIDPNSLYAQEMEEQGITVGNPVTIKPGERFELFEDNKRFNLYSKITGWFEPDYAYPTLERQVTEERKANPGKIPVITINSRTCLGYSTGCGWKFEIEWKNR